MVDVNGADVAVGEHIADTITSAFGVGAHRAFEVTPVFGIRCVGLSARRVSLVRYLRPLTILYLLPPPNEPPLMLGERLERGRDVDRVGFPRWRIGTLAALLRGDVLVLFGEAKKF